MDVGLRTYVYMDGRRFENGSIRTTLSKSQPKNKSALRPLLVLFIYCFSFAICTIEANRRFYVIGSELFVFFSALTLLAR